MSHPPDLNDHSSLHLELTTLSDHIPVLTETNSTHPFWYTLSFCADNKIVTIDEVHFYSISLHHLLRNQYGNEMISSL